MPRLFQTLIKIICYLWRYFFKDYIL